MIILPRTYATVPKFTETINLLTHVLRGYNVICPKRGCVVAQKYRKSFV